MGGVGMGRVQAAESLNKQGAVSNRRAQRLRETTPVSGEDPTGRDGKATTRLPLTPIPHHFLSFLVVHLAWFVFFSWWYGLSHTRKWLNLIPV